MKQRCMVLLVENNAGVLARISSLFVQRGFNIDSLTVSPTENSQISRLTIMSTGDEKTFQQIIKQTGKLIETKLIFSVEPSFSLIREILLIKFAPSEANNAELGRLVDMYGARVVDRTGGCIVVELTDTPNRINGFIDSTKNFEVVESCRSGAIAMERGDVSYEL